MSSSSPQRPNIPGPFAGYTRQRPILPLQVPGLCGVSVAHDDGIRAHYGIPETLPPSLHIMLFK